MIEYKKAVIEFVGDEYKTYKSVELKQDPEQIYEDCHRIYFNREITDCLTSEENDLSDGDYRCLYEDRGHILSLLWDYYLKMEYATVVTWQDIEQMIRGYNKHYHSAILKAETEI